MKIEKRESGNRKVTGIEKLIATGGGQKRQ
jgi:hypothetical protein